MAELKPFQVGVLMFFGALALIGVIIFATYSSISNRSTIGTVTVWGTLPHEAFDAALATLRTTQTGLDTVKYVQKDAATYDTELLDALAGGSGPDLIVFSQDTILDKESKLNPITFSQISERTFRDTFINEADLFVTKQGILGLPFAVDPLVSCTKDK